MLFFTGVFNSFAGFASLFVSATLFVARLDENYKADKRTSQIMIAQTQIRILCAGTYHLVSAPCALAPCTLNLRWVVCIKPVIIRQIFSHKCSEFEASIYIQVLWIVEIIPLIDSDKFLIAFKARKVIAIRLHQLLHVTKHLRILYLLLMREPRKSTFSTPCALQYSSRSVIYALLLSVK